MAEMSHSCQETTSHVWWDTWRHSHFHTCFIFPLFSQAKATVTWVNVKIHRTLPVLDFHLDILSLSVGTAYHLINCAKTETDHQGNKKSNSCQTQQLCCLVPLSPLLFFLLFLRHTRKPNCCFNTITLIQLILMDTLKRKARLNLIFPTTAAALNITKPHRRLPEVRGQEPTNLPDRHPQTFIHDTRHHRPEAGFIFT